MTLTFSLFPLPRNACMRAALAARAGSPGIVVTIGKLFIFEQAGRSHRARDVTASPLPKLGILASLLLALAACGSGNADDSGGGAGKSGRGGRGGATRESGYVVVQPTNVPIPAELAGRTSAYQVS